MTGAELIAYVKEQIQENYPDPQWIDMINLCLDDLTPISKRLARKLSKSLFLSEGKAVIALPEDVHEIIGVWVTPDNSFQYSQLNRLELNDEISAGYKIIDKEIWIQELNNYKTGVKIRTDYYKKLAHISVATLNSPPDLETEYHGLILSFLMSEALHREQKDYSKPYADYVFKKKGYALDRLWETEPESRAIIHGERLAYKMGASLMTK